MADFGEIPGFSRKSRNSPNLAILPLPYQRLIKMTFAEIVYNHFFG